MTLCEVETVLQPIRHLTKLPEKKQLTTRVINNRLQLSHTVSDCFLFFNPIYIPKIFSEFHSKHRRLMENILFIQEAIQIFGCQDWHSMFNNYR